MRAESDAQHLSRALGPQQQRALYLPSQETTRLARPVAIEVRLKWLTPIEDQFRMTIGNYSLRRGVLAVMLQNPKRMHEVPQPGRRSDFTIPDHRSMIPFLGE